ncbi:MAG: rhodanese-like domain-containing protein [Thermodesulfobacteriota bacterium]
MQKKILQKFVPVMIFFALLVGCGAKNGEVAPAAGNDVGKTVVQKEQNVYKGEVTGKSEKAKTISMKVGKGEDAKSVMVKFDDQTTGLEFAEKGQAAIVEYRMVGSDKVATVIKPKLAELPKGTSEAKTDYVAALIAKGGAYQLIDSRPAGRFHAGSLPTAVSIPVDQLKKEGAGLLPKDKNTELIFFCGGPT